MNKDLKERMTDVWGAFVKRLQSKQIRQENAGKHRAGRRPRTENRARLLASRKHERQARKFARLCADGKKHQARG